MAVVELDAGVAMGKVHLQLGRREALASTSRYTDARFFHEKPTSASEK